MARWEDQHRRDHKREEPPNSRLFIVCGKDLSDEDFQEAFSKFGSIEEIWMVKDKISGEKKGVAYIKFSRTSEAALAMEEMNGKCIARSPRPLKVLIAHNRDQGSKREMNEEERLLRLFIVAPRLMSEQDLRIHFSQFGDVEHVTLVRDKVTKESKGFGYVKYHKMSHAALAFENCDRMFRAVFADPKPVRNQTSGGSSQSGQTQTLSTASSSEKDLFTGHPVTPLSVGLGTPSLTSGTSGLLRQFPTSFDQLSSTACTRAGSTDSSGTRLVVLASPQLNQDQLWRLFDIVPGLDFCDLRRKSGQGRSIANVVYNNAQSANYAVEKLHGFEYPPGERLIVKFYSGFGDNLCGLFDNKLSSAATLPNVSGGTASGGSAATAAMAAVAAAAAAASQGVNGNQISPEIARQVSTLMDTLVTCQNLMQAGNFNNENAGLVGNLLGLGTTPDLNTAPGISPMLGQNVLTGLNSASGGEMYDPSYCSVKLPAPQPLAPPDSSIALRLFIVCYPVPPALYALKDVFGRFGGLIDVYILHNKNYGYAKYANKAGAERAVAVLHGQEILGSRLKVMIATDPNFINASSTTSSTSTSLADVLSASTVNCAMSGSGSSTSSSSSGHLSDRADCKRIRIERDATDTIDGLMYSRNMDPENCALCAFYDLPNEVLMHILSFLPYEELSRCRLVNRKFNIICGHLLTLGLKKADEMKKRLSKQIRRLAPRRESLRRKHALACTLDILSALDVRMSLLSMSYMRYVGLQLCPVVPGKVLDEIFALLRRIASCPTNVDPDILVEIRDISSMAVEHFEENIAPVFKEMELSGHGKNLNSLKRVIQAKSESCDGVPSKQKLLIDFNTYVEMKNTARSLLKEYCSLKRRLNCVETAVSEMHRSNFVVLEAAAEENKSRIERLQEITASSEKLCPGGVGYTRKKKRVADGGEVSKLKKRKVARNV
ncbi:unnamed protein product [Notodromas monacha]|uniref:RNA-binding protein 45 n=1 Tax=Notodromas monacha TaxID=399045 RepID=A0A7R9GB66_9CRUS|nr:unnamed protein product [Notodromas monacha]CAG0914484.1 unnamed protein product [Notodromas monacha]